MNKATHGYVGRLKCGCPVAFTLDRPGHEKETGKDVAEFIADGYLIERVPVEGIRVDSCIHKPKPDPQLFPAGSPGSEEE